MAPSHLFKTQSMQVAMRTLLNKISGRGIAVFTFSFLMMCMVAYIALHRMAPSEQTAQVTTIDIAEAAPTKQAGYPTLTNLSELPWRTVSLPNDWGLVWAQHVGVTWYRAKFQKPKNDTHLAIAVRFISMGGVLFVNGKEIGKTDVAWPPRNAVWYTPQRWPLPIESLVNGENEILFAVYGIPGMRPGLGRIQIGDAVTLERETDNRYLLQQYATYVMVLTSLIVSVLCLFWGVSIKKNTSPIWQSISIFSVAALMSFLQDDIYFLYSQYLNVEQMMRISSICAVMFALTFFMAALRFFERHYPTWESYVWALGVGMITLCCIVPVEDSRLLEILTFGVVLLIMTGTCYFVQWQGWRPQAKITEKIYAFVYFFFPIVALYDVAVSLTYVPELFLLEIFGITLNNVVIVGLYGWRFLFVSSQTDERKAQLQQEVLRANHELGDALIAKYQAQLKQAQEQERLQFWRDIHDGFSSALIGTISVLERQTMDQQHAAQLLQDMREELELSVRASGKDSKSLREILEPVRLSMTERLEFSEIDLMWLQPPDAIVNGEVAVHLPLIVRESLVNVLKHSRATQVICKFRVIDRVLTGFIQDNGEGCDAATPVKEYSGGLGLRSIRQRVEQLNGQCFWDKLPTGVTVQFSIPLIPSTVHEGFL